MWRHASVWAVLAVGAAMMSSAWGADNAPDPKTKSADIYRASQVVGMSVRNPQTTDKLGKIEDLVVDFRMGHVRYAALSFGGVLGIGYKLFAVPWKAMEMRHAEDGNFLALSVPKDRLKSAPGFDQNAWPNFGETRWSADVDTFYGADQPTAKVETPAGDTKYAMAHRFNDVRGMKVENLAGKSIGKVEDLVIDVSSGKLRYAALSFGGLLGIGNKLFAIPISAMEYRHDDKGSRFVLDISKERLDQAPGFDKDNWPDFANDQWINSDRFFGDRKTQELLPQ
ncbi:MAG: PRC-barrel domain-containing protein [Planctomycetia bacterium]|nr:PRC-barrel domain-containing protein [Planctomycetia bacterium]